MKKTLKILLAIMTCSIFVASFLLLAKKSRGADKSPVSLSDEERNVKKYIIPNLIGEDFDRISSDHNIIKIGEEYSNEYPEGRIISQSPNHGNMCNNNKLITVVVSKGADSKPLPEIRGKYLGEASSILAGEGFIPEARVVQIEGEKEGIVIGYTDEDLDAGTNVKSGQKISIDVSG